MCRQAWFPPTAARKTETLAAFLVQLEKSCGGHGNGAGWVDPSAPLEEDWAVFKSEKLSNTECAEIIANRPQNAWGMYHTRLVSAGVRGDEGCHPHMYRLENTSELVILTHNGTWGGWDDACTALGFDLPSDSATIAFLIAKYGWEWVSSRVDQTYMVAVRKAERDWEFVLRKNAFPLYLLKNGGIASEGGFGEFEETRVVTRGVSRMESPKSAPISIPTTKMCTLSTYKKGKTSKEVDESDSYMSWLEKHYGGKQDFFAPKSKKDTALYPQDWVDLLEDETEEFGLGCEAHEADDPEVDFLKADGLRVISGTLDDEFVDSEGD